MYVSPIPIMIVSYPYQKRCVHLDRGRGQNSFSLSEGGGVQNSFGIPHFSCPAPHQSMYLDLLYSEKNLYLFGKTRFVQRVFIVSTF